MKNEDLVDTMKQLIEKIERSPTFLTGDIEFHTYDEHRGKYVVHLWFDQSLSQTTKVDDAEPLTDEQEKFLEECKQTYKANPIEEYPDCEGCVDWTGYDCISDKLGWQARTCYRPVEGKK